MAIKVMAQHFIGHVIPSYLLCASSIEVPLLP